MKSFDIVNAYINIFRLDISIFIIYFLLERFKQLRMIIKFDQVLYSFKDFVVF